MIEARWRGVSSWPEPLVQFNSMVTFFDVKVFGNLSVSSFYLFGVRTSKDSRYLWQTVCAARGVAVLTPCLEMRPS